MVLPRTPCRTVERSIIIGSPILAAIYNKMGDTLPMPTKFAIGMVMCSGAFLILPLGAKFASDAGIVSVSWLVASYGLQSIGELMIDRMTSFRHHKQHCCASGRYRTDQDSLRLQKEETDKQQ